MNISNKYLRVSMPDGTKWDVPVMEIAKNRAENYKDEFGNDLERSLQEDTLPLFEDDNSEVLDWAANNMDWLDVAEFALQVPLETVPTDYQEGWVNGKKEFITREGAQ
jgi:hypothetical protein